jgi:hypothetical protein
MPPPDGLIVVTQRNPSSLTAVHSVTNPVVVPPVSASPAKSFRFLEKPLPAKIREFLFRVEKDGSVFWVGAVVSENVTDLTRAQVFFHPTVVQGHTVHARDADYRDFKGGWPMKVQRYMPRHGGQLAGAGKDYPLLFPFTTMAALARAGANMFSSQPVETLNAVMSALSGELKMSTCATLQRVGAASFSSGNAALRSFLKNMQSSGVVREVSDFDGPFIIGSPQSLIRFRGAWSRCYTQQPVVHPQAGWVTLTTDHFAHVQAFRGLGLHQQIGWMMYYQAMLNSSLELEDNPY